MQWIARVFIGICAVVVLGLDAAGQDWSQWRGDQRDGKAAEFSAPATWPKELTKKWSVEIGNGVATPSLVGKRLYVFTRQDGNEVARALDAATGDEIWKDAYPSEGTSGGASGFPGPRSSPTVAEGKVVTLGVRGILSCYDAESGKLLWRKDDFPGKWPMFFTSSSPVVVDGMCIAQLGGQGDGGIVAYDLATGDEKWRWTEEGPSNGSPIVMSIDGTQVLIAPTEQSLVGLRTADGKQVWKIPYTQDRGTTATPMSDGNTLLLAGPGSGITAIGLNFSGEELAEEELWKNTDNSVRFNTPTLNDGLLFGLSNSSTLFCINLKTHATPWSNPLGGPEPPSPFGPFGPGGPRGPGRRGGERNRGERPGVEAPSGDSARAAIPREILAQVADPPATETPESNQPATREGRDNERMGREGRGEGRGPGERGPEGRRRFGRGRGGRGGGGGYGSIVSAGSVMLVLSPSMELVVYEQSDTAFKELARYKVSDTATYAYPVASGKRIYVKDQDNLTLWTVE